MSYLEESLQAGLFKKGNYNPSIHAGVNYNAF